MAPFGIFNKFFKSVPSDSSYLSLVLTSDKVIACIWNLNDADVEIVGIRSKRFAQVDNLVHQAAVAIDAAGEKAKSDVSQVVFGLSGNWLEDGQPTAETSRILKDLSRDLELEPQAFIPIAAAVNHFAKIEESRVFHAVLVVVLGDFCEVHLIKNDKVVRSVTSQKATNVTAQTITGLVVSLKDNQEELPPRVLVYGQDESPDLAKELARVNWRELSSGQELFAQEPKVEPLSEEQLAKSVAYAQAADILGYEPAVAIPDQDRKIESQKTKGKANELGFVAGEDILATPDEDQNIKDQGLRISDKHHEKISPEPDKQREVPDLYAVEDAQEVVYPKMPSRPHKAGFFNLLRGRLTAKRVTIALVVLLVIIFAGTFIAGQFFSSAEITIKVNAKNLEEDFRATIVKGDSSGSQIPGQEVVGQAQGSQKAVATGSKKLGEKAKGELTVFNWTTSPKTFVQETTVISKNGLKFTLDSEVQVASRSASVPGQNKTPATASDVGPSGNLEAGTDFTFQEFDEILYSARNDAAFSGGDEKQVTVVSSEDLERLEKSLSDSIFEKAKVNLREKATGKILHDGAISTKIVRKDFDKKLEEEASLVNLTMEVEATAIVYDQSDLKKFLSQSIGDEVPENLQIREEDIEILETEVKRQPNSLSLSGKFRANLIPKLKEEELKDRIAGKSVKEARRIIKEVPEVDDVTVNFSPNIALFSSLPQDKSKIKFKIEPR